MSNHIKVQDPSEMSSRYGYTPATSEEDKVILEELMARDIEDEEISEKSNFETALEPYLKRIPGREADLLTMYYKQKMKQEQIAKLFSITQAAVSYRLTRGIKRIQFLRTIPELDFKTFEEELGVNLDEQDKEIMWRMYETTCQSEIAKVMGLTQGRVRHRFFRALGKIKEWISEEIKVKQQALQIKIKHDAPMEEIEEAKREMTEAIKNSKLAKYFTVFHAISDGHFNILHEVSLPQFKDRGYSQIVSLDYSEKKKKKK